MRSVGGQHRDLWEEVYTELRDLIVVGELRSGERLVTAALASRFEVSNGPVRTALLQLERMGLVRFRGRRGCVVTTLSPDDVNELYAVRAALEIAAVRNGRRDQVAASLSALRKSLENLEDAMASGDWTAAVECDLEFHRELCRMSGNARLLQAWQMQADQIRLVIGAVHRTDPSIAARSGEHWSVMRALEDGDQPRAGEALERHLSASQQVMEAGARRLATADPSLQTS